MSLSDPLSPTSTIGSVPHPPRSRSPNATPMPPHHPRLPGTLASRKPSGANLRSVSNTQTSPIVSSKLTAQPLVAVAKSPKVSRTAQAQEATRARKVSGVSAGSYQPRSRAQSLVSQSSESVQVRPPSPTKKPALPQPESPAHPSPVKPKPRLGGVANVNGSPRPPAKTPGSRNTSGVFPPLENNHYTPSPSPPKLPAVVWPVDEEEESINGDWAPSLRPPVSGGTSEAYDFSGIPLGSEGVPHYRAEDEMTMELITEIDDGGELDEDMQAALRAIHLTHVKKLTHYKRLLEGAQTSSASQLHALQAELRMLRAKLEEERRKKRELEMSANKDREALKVAQMRSALQQPQPASMNASVDLSTLLRGDGQGGFNETEIRRAVRAMRASDRLRLIHIILDSCLPGDISAMIRMLEKYAASTFDIVGNLPEDVAIKILGHLNVTELLEVEIVSKKWHMLVRHPAIWRHLCVELTATDPVPLRPPPNPEDWEPLYRSLHHRERNWATGQVQTIRFLKGHTGFCTTLILKGNRLISGSYDETIRVWDIRAGEEKKCLKVKAISCLDYLPDEEVLVAGFHDVGRVQLFSTVTWQPIQTLQGHLYGIRAVALSPKYLVSAGADKALVCWDWRAGQKIVRFGQQTNLNIGVQIVDEDEGRIVGITIDGIVRTFSIPRREMLSQFKLSELGGSDPVLSAKLSTVGVGSANMLQWFAAKGKQMTCATKNLILHLEHEDSDPSVSLSSSIETLPKPQPQPRPQPQPLTPPNTTHTRPRHSLAVPPRPESRSMPLHGRKSMGALLSPATTTNRATSMFMPNRPGTSLGRPGTSMGRPGTSMGGASPNKGEKKPVKPPVLLSVVDTPDVAVGAVDPKKRRVATSTRFSSRLGADRRIFVSTYNLAMSRAGKPQPEELPEPAVGAGDVSNVDFDTEIATLGGAWAALAEESEHGWPAQFNVPAGFKGLATPEKNPMAMALSHEEVVVGTADGTIYVMGFVGYQYKASKENLLGDLVAEEAEEQED
ncbi:F-box/WD repeat-containing protein 7 OS=Homo sapiens GN=FBXW7 PE=1 SV=1 [Rhizoctonia solani AG-1 IB]|uniref:F-box/WD repeat-containing protein 7 n=1 Tax=Thanatephorus cucumeris (strain AG1-IB / isolate 7/3/14) TaxID=1108050 RepID=A0A0B7FHB9_THACB|nr:F-box/WD repeat-containing protein 7 OS=Homo sapiens GN=FBXW7 PE=1 SV=1 [Rhizoctonia solani AG-1 IB]